MKGNLNRMGKYFSPIEVLEKGGLVDHNDIHHAARHNEGFPIDQAEAGDITKYFQPITARTIDSPAYMGNTGDYNGPYDVSDVKFNVPADDYKLYIRHKRTIGNASYWQNDTCVAHVQILDADGAVLHNIATNMGKWQTTTTEQSTTSVTPNTASNYTYSSTFFSTNATRRWNVASGTGSGSTGCFGGIKVEWQSSTTPMPIGRESLAQDGSTNFIFHETSSFGTTSNNYLNNYSAYARSVNEYAIPAKGSIRIAYAITTGQESALDSNQTLYVGFY